MRLLLYTLATLIITVALGLSLADYPGYVVIAFQKTVIETPLWVALLALVMLIFIWSVIKLLFSSTINVVKDGRAWLQRLQQQRFNHFANQGITALSQANWQKAEHCLMKANKQQDSLLINWLLAALSAGKQNNADVMEYYLQQAAKLFTGYELPINLTHAYLTIHSQQYVKAINIVAPLREKYPKNKMILQLLLELYQKTANWDELAQLLPLLASQQIISQPDYQVLIEKIYSKKLLTLPEPDKNKLQQLWAAIPKDFRQQIPLVRIYVRLLIESKDYLQAERVITRYLGKQWDDQLVLYYSELRNIDDKKQLKRAENWLDTQPKSAALLLMLGKLCVHQRLWGKAKQYLQHSLHLEELPQAHYELGKIFSELGEEQLAKQHFKQGLQVSLQVSS